jgi:tetratricopeptide (TPR) repeat protein
MMAKATQALDQSTPLQGALSGLDGRDSLRDSIYVLAIRLYETKNYPQALRLMEYVLRAQKPEFKHVFSVAVILQADQQLERALAFYERSALLDHAQDPRVTLGKAQCLILLKEYSQALPCLAQTWERLKGAGVSPQLRNQLVKTCSALMDRVGQLTKT